MASKHPSSRSVVLTIAAIIATIAAASYGLGVKNMTKEEVATVEESAPAASEAPSKASVEAADALLQPTAGDISFGKADAPVTVIEYSSLSCPHCAHFHNDEFAEIKKSSIDSGKARFIVRTFPLNAPALKGAMLVECVKPEEKAKFLKVLFSMQNKWAFDVSYLDALKQIASVGGLSAETFDACMNDKTAEEALIKRVEAASKALNIQGTPTFFINGKKFEGTPDASSMAKAIEAAQAK